MHCTFCGRDGHIESKCFKKMESLEEMMKKHTINLDSSSSTSSSHGHALFASSFSFNATSTSCSDEWLIDFGATYHMAKDKSIFSPLNECNMIWIGSSYKFSCILVHYRWKKLEESACGPILVVGPSLEN
jgi:hypothetical protein